MTIADVHCMLRYCDEHITDTGNMHIIIVYYTSGRLGSLVASNKKVCHTDIVVNDLNKHSQLNMRRWIIIVDVRDRGECMALL